MFDLFHLFVIKFVVFFKPNVFFQAGRKRKYQQECLEKVFFFCRWSIFNSLVLKSQRNGKPFVVYFYRDVTHSLNLFRFNEICWASIDFILARISFLLEAVRIDLIICLSCLFNGIFLLFLISKLFIMIPIIGATRKNIIFLEERPGLTKWKPSYRLTGTHHSPRSVSVWRSTKSSDSLLLIWKPTLCTHWSLTENTARQFWVVRHGGLWLVQRPPRRSTVTERGSIFTHWQLFGSLGLLKQGSVLSPTMQITVMMLKPESGLVLEGHMMTPTRVESLQTEAILIMESSSLKPWGTSWCSDERKL